MYDFKTFNIDEKVRLKKMLPFENGINLLKLGGIGRYTISISGSLDPRSEWKNGIYYNSRHFTFFWNEQDGAVEQTNRFYKLKAAKFRKTKAKSLEQFAAIVNAWVAKAKKIDAASSDTAASISGADYENLEKFMVEAVNRLREAGLIKGKHLILRDLWTVLQMINTDQTNDSHPAHARRPRLADYIGRGRTDGFMSHFYYTKNLSDSHIETALKKILKKINGDQDTASDDLHVALGAYGSIFDIEKAKSIFGEPTVEHILTVAASLGLDYRFTLSSDEPDGADASLCVELFISSTGGRIKIEYKNIAPEGGGEIVFTNNLPGYVTDKYVNGSTVVVDSDEAAMAKIEGILDSITRLPVNPPLENGDGAATKVFYHNDKKHYQFDHQYFIFVKSLSPESLYHWNYDGHGRTLDALKTKLNDQLKEIKKLTYAIVKIDSKFYRDNMHLSDKRVRHAFDDWMDKNFTKSGQILKFNHLTDIPMTMKDAAVRLDTASDKPYFYTFKLNDDKEWDQESGFTKKSEAKEEMEWLDGEVKTIAVEVNNKWALDQIKKDAMTFWDSITKFIAAKKPRHGAFLKFGPENMPKSSDTAAETDADLPKKFKLGYSKVGKKHYFGIVSPTVALNRGNVAKIIMIDVNAKHNTKLEPSNIKIGKSYRTAKNSGFMFEYTIVGKVKAGRDKASVDTAGPGYHNIEKIGSKLIGYSAGMKYLIQKGQGGGSYYTANVRGADWQSADTSVKNKCKTGFSAKTLKELSTLLEKQNAECSAKKDKASVNMDRASLASTIQAFLETLVSAPVNEDARVEWTGQTSSSTMKVINSLVTRLMKSRRFPEFKFNIDKTREGTFVDIFRPATMNLKGVSAALAKVR